MNDQTKTFEARCYELLKLIPKGKVTTYGEIARALNTKAYQAVGNAMAKNKNLLNLMKMKMMNQWDLMK